MEQSEEDHRRTGGGPAHFARAGGGRDGVGETPVFDDVRARTAEFIGWSHTIRLTREQEETKRQALGANPAGYSGDSCHRGGCPKRFSAPEIAEGLFSDLLVWLRSLI